MNEELLNNLKKIKIDSPVDVIIRQIRELISSGQLNAGDRLPSERQLAETFGVGRTYVRDAIKKLEFYGILKTLPQSGTVVAGLGLTALEGLITGILKLEKRDFASLVETRVVLEAEAARLASERRTEKDLEILKEALEIFHSKVKLGDPAVEEDLMFHLKIAEASKNSVIKSLMLIVTPEIIQIYNDLRVCSDGRSMTSYKAHLEVLEHIKDKDGKSAEKAMRQHLKGVMEFSHSNLVAM